MVFLLLEIVLNRIYRRDCGARNEIVKAYRYLVLVNSQRKTLENIAGKQLKGNKKCAII
jgi:hypothetical protein